MASLDKDKVISKLNIIWKNFLYPTLPESGEGLTKKSANTEWEEFLDNTDIMAKLEYVTKGYKELEKILNKPNWWLCRFRIWCS